MVINLENGLNSEEVLKKIKEFGYNEILEKKINPIYKFIKKFWGVSAWMLEIAIILTGIIGKYLEMLIITGLLFFNAILGFIEEEKANSAIDFLKKRLYITVRIKRDGKWIIIPAREIVPGDIIRLRVGDFVPADAKIIEGSVEVDQASLTGESLPIEKNINDILYGGSVVKKGEATGFVTSTGTKTYFGRTIELVQITKPKLQMEIVTSKVVKWLLLMVICLILIGSTFIILKGMNVINILPLTVMLLVSTIPVALPTMFMLSMALGSLELSKKGVLVTKLDAIEGAATMNVICMDKTGTITLNKLSIGEVSTVGDYRKEDVILYGALASQEANQDPIDLAFISAVKDMHIPVDNYSQKDFIPFDLRRRRTQATIERDGHLFIVLKGAFNTMIQLCKIDQNELAKMEKDIGIFSSKGYRIIAVAEGSTEDNIGLVGIAALYDKPRSDSPQIINELKELGVTVKMLTGDALPIAKETAKQIGLEGNIITVSDLKNLTKKAETDSLIDESSGFAEIYPEDKFFIVENLHKLKHVVGMTGDGVNDTPALKNADVGIAVSNATDEAKKASSVVLTTNELEGINHLVKIGRMAYQRIITWILNKISKNFLVIVSVILALILISNYIMSVLSMILFLFLTDFITLSLSTDNVRYSKKPDIWNITGLVKIAVILGILMVAEFIFLFYIGCSYFGLINNLNQLRMFVFDSFMFFGIFNIFIVRERKHFWNSRPSKPLFIAIVGDLFIILVISSTLNLLDLSSIDFFTSLFVLTYSLFACLFINDSLKVILMKKFWAKL